MVRLDLTWKEFWRLVVILLNHIQKNWSYRLCKCSCGNNKIICWTSLIKWRSKSCGCLRKELLSKKATHRMWKTKIYRIRARIKSRCTDKNITQYKDYWWRWITYDPRREKFEWFYEDMYEWYKQWLSIDRIDNNWNYCKENCRWATRKEQNNNQRSNYLLEYNWLILNITQWAEKLWLSRNLLSDRIHKLWWSIEKSLTTPKKLF